MKPDTLTHLFTLYGRSYPHNKLIGALRDLWTRKLEALDGQKVVEAFEALLGGPVFRYEAVIAKVREKEAASASRRSPWKRDWVAPPAWSKQYREAEYAYKTGRMSYEEAGATMVKAIKTSGLWEKMGQMVLERLKDLKTVPVYQEGAV